MKVVIDAGHGGKDPGAVRNNIKEADICLSIAKKVARKLTEAEVILTRTKDEYVTLAERVKVANEANADYYVSIHCNAAKNEAANGYECWHSIKGGKSKELAEKIIQKLQNTPLKDRGLKTKANKNGQDYMYVIRKTKCPAVLVEIGFLSNQGDRAYITSMNGKETIAAAIAAAIQDVKKEA